MAPDNIGYMLRSALNISLPPRRPPSHFSLLTPAALAEQPSIKSPLPLETLCNAESSV